MADQSLPKPVLWSRSYRTEHLRWPHTFMSCSFGGTHICRRTSSRSMLIPRRRLNQRLQQRELTGATIPRYVSKIAFTRHAFARTCYYELINQSCEGALQTSFHTRLWTPSLRFLNGLNCIKVREEDIPHGTAQQSRIKT